MTANTVHIGTAALAHSIRLANFHRDTGYTPTSLKELAIALTDAARSGVDESNTAEVAGFIVHDLDGGLIWGIGGTEEAAWADARASGCTLSADELVSVPATGRLVERVASWGGDTRWVCVKLFDGKVVADIR